MIAAWRLCKSRRLAEAFSGQGARRYPGRWNLEGEAVVYVAENRSLAALEVMVHAGDRALLEAADWTLIAVRFPPEVVETPARLPRDWRSARAPESTRHLGSEWLRRGSSAVLRVPSVVTPGEFNYLLNPAHPDFGQIETGPVEAFRFDLRLSAG